MSPEPTSSAAPRVRRRRPAWLTLLLSLLVTAIDAALLMLALGGFAALVGHPRAPALIGVWAVTGAVLALKRPIGAQDVVEIDRESPWMLIGLALVPMLTPPVAALGERLRLWIVPGGAALGWTGVAFVALGLGLRIAAMSQLGPRFSPLLAVQRQHVLETRGLYRRIRHPGYLGAWLAAWGAVLTFRSALGLAPLLLFGVLLATRAGREERLMEARFGQAWRDYRAESGAFFPRL